MIVKSALAPLFALCLLLPAACANARHGAEAASDQAKESEVVKKDPVQGPPKCEMPRYPRSSLEKEEQGVVDLSFLISADGYVTDSKIVKSSGSVELDEAARIAIAKCRFKPNLKDGVAVDAWSPVRYTWSLE